MPDSANLDFRDIQAFDDRTAALLSIGPGELSRIYRTSDGGTNLDAPAHQPRPERVPRRHRLLGRRPRPGPRRPGRRPLRDPGHLRRREDLGQVPVAGMPEALPGEGAFAASGTCLVVQGRLERLVRDRRRGLGPGLPIDRPGADLGRRPAPRSGREIPRAGDLLARLPRPPNGMAVGGDYKPRRPDRQPVATTSDGGRTWTPADRGKSPRRLPIGRGLRARREGREVVAVGPSGADLSIDGGLSWKHRRPGFHAFGFGTTSDSGWAVGEARPDRQGSPLMQASLTR